MPYLAAIFVVVGTLVGVARGGRLYRIAENVPRAWPLLPFGVALVLQSGHPGLPGAKWVHLAGYGYLLAFALINLRRTFAATLLAVAVVANGAVIVANGRMPYVQSAAINVGAYHGASDLNADHPTREWVTSETRFPELARKYEIKPTHEVVSPGDLALSLAAGWLAMYMLLPSRRRLARLRPVEYRTTSEERAARRRTARQGRRRTNTLTPLDPADHAYDIAAIRTEDGENSSPYVEAFPERAAAHEASTEPWAAHETSTEPWAAHETSTEPWAAHEASTEPWAAHEASTEPWAAHETSTEPWAAHETSTEPWAAHETSTEPTGHLPGHDPTADAQLTPPADRYLADGPHEVPAGWAIDESAFAPNDALPDLPHDAAPRDDESLEHNPWRARDDR